jgi:hypothetical protein
MLSIVNKYGEIEMAKKSLFTFDRWDFLGTRIVLGVVALGSATVGVVVPLARMVQGEPLIRQLDTGRTDALVTDELTVNRGAALTWPGIADASIEDAGVGTWLTSILPGAVLATGAVIVVLALLRLLSSIEAGAPFAPAAVRSLRIVGATLLVGSVLVTVADAFADRAVLEAAVILESEATFTLDLRMVVIFAGAGLVCAALAEAFARGIELAADVEGLV